MKRDMETAICKGLRFLESNCSGGRFSSCWGADQDMNYRNGENRNDTFVSIMVGNCLLDCQGKFSEYDNILTKICGFLLGKFERSPVISFFHSPAGTKKFPKEGDSTASAASVLIRAGADRKLFQKTAEFFWNNYNEKEGDFRVYFGNNLQPRKKERFDPMATMAMIIFLVLMGEKLLKLERPINKIFSLYEKKSYLEEGFSFYYHRPIVCLYYLGMMAEYLNLSLDKKVFIKRVNEIINTKKDPNIVDLAMGITSVARFGEVNLFLISILIGMQEIDGSWPIASLYRLGRKDRGFPYAGSFSVSTALAIQALCRSLELL